MTFLRYFNVSLICADPGFYYLHPSWVENGKVKPEFMDKIPENVHSIYDDRGAPIPIRT